VTESGRIVKALETREDFQGHPIKLTIDGPLQDYAARRVGLESGSVVVIDCLTGGILALVSMPAFDPNSFVGGIGRQRWAMLNQDDHIPLLNKAMRGLYPPGSTMKPMATLALQAHGISPAETVHCPGGYQLGNRFFRCDAVHGTMDMRNAIAHSCNTYFWSMAHKVGYDVIAPVAKALGLGQEFDLPGTSQRYGTIPDAAWKMRRYKQEWTASDALNAAIGQGYVLVSPLQMAVMTARMATGKNLTPSLLFGDQKKLGPALPFTPEMLQVTHEGMFQVVNGAGTAARSKLLLDGIQMAGKTGTAQVRRLTSRGHVADWASRDHSHFICYAPTDKPRYAMSVVIEHGGFGASAAAPIARDVMTFLFDPAQAMETLHAKEAEWGGTMQQRMDAKYAAFVGEAQVAKPLPSIDDYGFARVDAESRMPQPAPSVAPSSTSGPGASTTASPTALPAARP